MLKRRLAIVVTAAALGLAGMAGSALADEGPARVRHGAGRSIPAGGELTCWTSDGKVVTFSKARVVKLVRAHVIGAHVIGEHVIGEHVAGGNVVGERVLGSELAESVTEDGITTVPADRLSIGVPAKELPRKARKHRQQRRVVHLTCVWDGPVRK
ncbi:hypothetical protein [Nonomuraea sp. NPDC002799]